MDNIFSSKRLKKIYICAFIFIFFFIITCCIVMCLQISHNIERLNDNWRNEEGNVYRLPSKVNNKKNNWITLQRELPSQFNNKRVLVFKSNYQYVKIMLDDKLIYEYVVEDCSNNVKAPAAKWNFVEIPDNSDGNVIKISFMSPYNIGTENISRIYFSEHEREIIRFINLKYSVDILMGIILLIIGISFIIWFILKLPNEQKNNYLYLGVFTSLVGMWSIADNRGYEFFFSDLNIIEIISGVLLIIAAIVFCMYVKEYSIDKHKKIYRYIQMIYWIYLVALLFLQIIGKVDIAAIAPITYIINFFIILFYIYTYLIVGEKKYRKIVKYFIGYTCIATCIGELALNYSRYYEDSGFVFRIVVFIFILTNGMMRIHKDNEENKRYSNLDEIKNNQISLVVSQMHPHFTFNALNTIRYNVKANPELAYDMLYDFSKYIRGNIDSLSYKNNIDFLSEISHLKSYTNIEKERFKDKLDIEYDLQEISFMIPSLTILPLVENAIKHGVRAKSLPGKVIIRSYEKNDFYVIDIIDDGPGFEVEEVLANNEGKGISNVRMNLIKIQGAKLDIISNSDGTVARIKIPKE